MSGHRVAAVILRQLYLYRRSVTRVLEIIYWPFLDLVLWGFISLYLIRFAGGGAPRFAAFFIGALLLWDILFRSQLGLSVSFLEDVWARNFLNLFVSPLTPGEYMLALMVVSAVKLVLASGLMIVLARLFFSFDLFVLGVSLVPFVVNLVALGWAIGILTLSLILRYGQQAEILAWGFVLLFQPVSAVFYPVAVLPPALRAISRGVSASYVFEGMRSVIAGHAFPGWMLARASALNALYVAAALFYFFRVFKAVKRKGILAKIGE